MNNDPYTTLADETYYMGLEQEEFYKNLEKIEFDATVVKIMEYCNVSREEAIRIASSEELS
jgi:predicted GTPase